jgi:sulfate transport system permease protein
MNKNSVIYWSSKSLVERSRSFLVRYSLIAIALLFLFMFLILPLITIFLEAFQKGWANYKDSVTDPDTVSSIILTLIATAIALPLNTIFGIACAWAISKFSFRGKSLLITLIDIPLSISPVIVGLGYVLMFGVHGWIGEWLVKHDLKIIFALPGIVLSTIFVTFPLIAKQLIVLMQERGTDEEEAAVILGASGFQTFFYVTLPNIKWGLIYGILLSNARAMGEFGAVSVVSGHIRGQTDTVTLHIEVLYSEYRFASAFAVASLFTLLALLTLIVKSFIDRKLKIQDRNK